MFFIDVEILRLSFGDTGGRCKAPEPGLGFVKAKYRFSFPKKQAFRPENIAEKKLPVVAGARIFRGNTCRRSIWPEQKELLSLRLASCDAAVYPTRPCIPGQPRKKQEK